MTPGYPPSDPCHAALRLLERDVPTDDDHAWRERVREELRGLRVALAATDSTDRDLWRVADDAPRLVHAIQRLRQDREWLLGCLDALVLTAPYTPVATWKHAIWKVTAHVRAYRHRVANVLHEAYGVDIGGEM